jgi:hypothetical protein
MRQGVVIACLLGARALAAIAVLSLESREATRLQQWRCSATPTASARRCCEAKRLPYPRWLATLSSGREKASKTTLTLKAAAATLHAARHPNSSAADMCRLRSSRCATCAADGVLGCVDRRPVGFAVGEERESTACSVMAMTSRRSWV